MAEALLNEIRFKQVSLWIGAIDNSGQIVVDPLLFFTGQGDSIKIVRDASTAQIQWNVEGPQARWAKRSGRRMTDPAHQSRNPGDKFFNMLGGTVEGRIMWPARSFFQ